MLVCLAQCTETDETIDLGCGYTYSENSRCVILPDQKSQAYNLDFISAVSISYDDHYILVMEALTDKDYRYWIIDKMNDTIYGPCVDYTAFDEQLHKLSIPVRLQDPATYTTDGHTHCIIRHTIDESIKYIN